MNQLLLSSKTVIYCLALMATTSIALVVAYAAWLRRATPGTVYLTLCALAAALWSSGSINELIVAQLSWKITWAKFEYLGIVTIVPTYLLFVLEYSRRGRYLSRRNMALLWIMPIVTVALVFTNEWHHLIWAGVSLDDQNGIAIYQHGYWFWAWVVYSYALVMIGVVSLYRSTNRFTYTSAPGARWLILGFLIPIIGNVVYVLGVDPLPGIDLTPTGVAITGGLVVWGIYRYQLLGLVPVARANLVDRMTDGVLVLDTDNCIVDINQSARRMLGANNARMIGIPVQVALPLWADLENAGNKVLTLPDVENTTPGSARYMDVTMTPLVDLRKHAIGRLFVLRDITRHHQIERELEQANKRLQRQLDEINTLQSRLRSESLRDEVTGLYNRNYMFEVLKRSLGQARRDGQPLSLVLLELDRTQIPIDTYGRSAVNTMLRQVAELVNRMARGGDSVCRANDHRLAIVMPSTPPEVACELAEQWRLAVSLLKVTYGEMTLRATFSAGVAGYPGQNSEQADLLTAALQALQASVASGRNRVVLWKPDLGAAAAQVHQETWII